MTTLSLRLFGSPQVSIDNGPVSIPRAKAVALLFYLAATEEAHQRNHLATLLWPEFENATARTYLRQALYALTQSLGAHWFQSDRDQISLSHVSGLRVDLRDFRALAATTPVSSPTSVVVESWTVAAALVREPFLAGFSLADAPLFDDWLFFQREAIAREISELLTRLIVHYTEQVRFDRALQYAQQKLALDSLDELTHQLLMHLYAQTGQKSLALRQFARCEQLLSDELGVMPSTDTLELYASIQHEESPHREAARAASDGMRALLPGAPPGYLSTAFLSPARVNVDPSNLPEQPTHFIGREAELKQLADLLSHAETRLLTLVAPGGMGKTRLALAAARRYVQTGEFPDGVCFVPLATVARAEDVASAVATALNLSLQAGGAPLRSISRILCDFLADKRLLLILDNFEHLLESVSLLHDILCAASHIKILVTSRERLGMQGEQLLPIRGLDYDGAHTGSSHAENLVAGDAVRLFEQSARLILPEFAVDDQNLPHVLDICRLVEGMPLGLELAASWIGALAPTDIAAEIRTSLDFLEAGYRDMPARHQSIRAVFDSTWQRMEQADQAVFAALSVFRNGFSREAARDVSGATLRQLNSLVSKSLLEYDRRQRMYTIHELLRQYGAAQLNATPEVAARVRDRHCAYYMSFLADRQRAINTVGQGLAADAIAHAFANVRAAWQHLTEQEDVALEDVEALSRAAPTLFLFCQVRSRFLEGADLQQDAGTWLRGGAPSPLRDRALAQVLNHEGWLRIRVGDFARAETTLTESRRLYAALDRPPQPYTGSDPATGLAIIYEIQGDYEQAVAMGEAARAAAEENRDKYNLAHAHYVLTSAWAAKGEYATAARHAEQACEAARIVGNRWFLAIPLIEWGKVARAMGDLTQARIHFQTSYALKREFDDPEGMAVALCHLAEIAVLQAEFAEAEALYQQALTFYRDINDRGGLATAWHGLGKVAYGRGDIAQAREWLARALTLAVDAHFWPLVFGIFVDVGELICRHGDPASGIEVLAYVRYQPRADRAVVDAATHRLAQCACMADDAAMVAAATARGQTLMWEAVLLRVQGSLGTSLDATAGRHPR